MYKQTPVGTPSYKKTSWFKGKRDEQGDEEPKPASYLEDEGQTFSSDAERQLWESEQEQLDR